MNRYQGIYLFIYCLLTRLSFHPTILVWVFLKTEPWVETLIHMSYLGNHYRKRKREQNDWGKKKESHFNSALLSRLLYEMSLLFRFSEKPVRIPFPLIIIYSKHQKSVFVHWLLSILCLPWRHCLPFPGKAAWAIYIKVVIFCCHVARGVRSKVK